jgi:Kdo2-lipid IVA lauroyltransferase/acyltransferase
MFVANVRPPPPTGAPRWYWHSYNRVVAYRLAEGLGRLPRRWRLALARRLGGLALRRMPVERTAVRATLATITGASGARLDTLTRRVFQDFAACFSDLVTTNRRPPERLLDYVASVSASPVLEDDIGVVSVTAHVGNWEMAGRLLAGRTRRRTHVVVAPEAVAGLERWVRRDGDGVRFVARGPVGVGVELVAALRRGEVVALQGDRAIGTQGDALIPFFGRPAPFPLGPFILARAAGVPVVAAFCLLEPDDRYTVRIAPAVTVERGQEVDVARRWVAILEEVAREYPTQWFNFFDVWSPFGP